MPIKTADELHSLIRRILLAAGADERNARRVAEGLVSSNLCGVDTHGVWHLPLYVSWVKAGDIVPTAWPEVVRETPTSALVRGNWTFGQVAAGYAMEIAMEKAARQGMAVVGIVQTHHIGRLGEYAEMAASRGMASMIWASGYSEEIPVAVPHGGRKPVLGTNPVSIGFPAGEEPPMVFDFATTIVAGTKIMTARGKNELVPLGWIVDGEGVPTTDPSDFAAGGALVPFGGHKGYALMLAIEFLGRILTGADDHADPARGGPFMRHQGITMVVLRADLFQPLEAFARRADEMERRIRAIPPAPGFEEVLVPGDLEARTRALRQREGIPIPEDLWQSLKDVAGSVGLGDI